MKKKIIISLLSAIIICTVGVTYAFFSYTRTSEKSEIITGQIYMNYIETKNIYLINAFPESKEVALSRTAEDGAVFQFTIEGLNTSSQDIIYDIRLLEGAKVDDRTYAIKPEHIMIYLECDGEVLIDGMTYSDWNNRRVYVDTIPGETNQKIAKHYELRMWIDENVTISDTDPNADYTTSIWNDSYASLLVSVTGNFDEKNLTNYEISGSDTITVKSSGVTNSKYELIDISNNASQVNLLSDTSEITWKITPETSDIQIEDGLVTISETNTLDEFTIEAMVDNILFKKDIVLYQTSTLPDNLFDIYTVYEKEFADNTTGKIHNTENNDLFNTNYVRTDYIECDNNKTLFLNYALEYNVNSFIAFYDENKNYISGTNENNRIGSDVYLVNDSLVYGKIISVPEEAKYMIISGELSHYNKKVFSYHYINNEDISLYAYNLEYPTTSTLSNLKIANFGDSIFGNYSDGNDISSYLNTYYGSTNYNVAFGGTRMTLLHSTEGFEYFSMTSLADAIYTNDFTNQITNKSLSRYYDIHVDNLIALNFKGLDYVTLGFGTNDFTGNVLLEGNTPLDVNAYKGATRYSINRLKEVNPDIKIVLLTPIYRFWSSDNSDATNYTNEKGLYLSQYGNVLKEVAKEYENVYVYDGYNDLGINSFNKYVYFNRRDETHPNANGIKLYAYKLGKFIESLES